MLYQIVFLWIIITLCGSNICAQNEIVEAIKKDNVSFVRQKIGSTPDLFPINGKDGGVPLLIAIQHNAVQTVRWLLEQGADKEIKTRRGSSPLSLAAYYGYTGIVDVLIQAGANLATKSPNGYQPLDWALENEHLPVAEQLFYAWGKKQAVDSEEIMMLETIFKNEIPTFQYRKTWTSFPLVLAIVKKNANLVAKLLQSGYDPNTQNAAGYAPLPTAARIGDTTIINLLLKAGANPNLGGTKDNDVAGSLNQAARGLKVHAGKLLIRAGANPNKGNAKGITPLYICARLDGKSGVFTTMLLNEASLFLRQKADDGYEAFDAAMEARNRLFAQLIMKEFFLRSLPPEQKVISWLDVPKGNKPNIAALSGESALLLMNVAILKADSALFFDLLSRGINLNTKNTSGHYPLTLAASWGEKTMLRALLANGAQVDLQNENRYHTSALIESMRDGHVEIAQELLTHKADVNLKDVHNDHALNWAVFFGHKKAAEFLLNNGADPRQKGQQTNDNAMDIALRMNAEDIIVILRASGAKASK